MKAIGALEVLAAIGLILPPLVGVAEGLAPSAATAIAALMAGAAVVHGRRGELQMIVVNAALLTLTAVMAWGRFGPYAF
ncbi:DoxX family protein [Streptomyces sp. 900116325]